MAGIKKNFVYNLTLTLANYLFPLLTYPYVSRVLGPDNIGVCNYVDSIINYFVLFSALGVGSLGVREIARVKNDDRERSQVFSSLVVFNITLTLFSTAALICATMWLPFFEPYRPYLWVGVCKLVSSTFLIEWFYQGISNFRYITMRSIIVRTIYVLAVFLFIHSEDDVVIYYLLTCMMTVVNAAFNWIYSRRFVSLSLRSVRLGIYIAPILSYGLYLILTSMYTNFNVTYLGSVCAKAEVGYFATATKLYLILMGVFSAFTRVMVPKVSELLAQRDFQRLNTISGETFRLIFLCSLPAIAVSWFYAPLFVNLLAGTGYEAAVPVFRIVMALLLVIAMEQIVIQQFLMATRSSAYVTTLSLTGAIIGVGMNILLTPSLGAVGSACSWVMSECALLALGLLFFKRAFPQIRIPLTALVQQLALVVPYIGICLLLANDTLNAYSVSGLALCALWFAVSNLVIVRNDTLYSLCRRAVSRFRPNKVQP